MTIFRKQAKRQLQRADSASSLPPLDRAVARAICKLIVALDRQVIDECFFSRALAACNGALVWPEAVVRRMGFKSERRADESAQQAGPAPQCRRVALQNVQLPTGNEDYPFVPACALVYPDRLLELGSDSFRTFSRDALHRLMVARATLEWLDCAENSSETLPILRNVGFLGQALGWDADVTSIVELMALAVQSDAFRMTLGAIRCYTMPSAVDLLRRWVGGGRIPVLDGLFAQNGILVQMGLHEGLAKHISDLDDALRFGNPLIVSRLRAEHSNADSFLESFLNVSPPSVLTVGDIPHLERVHSLARSLLDNAVQNRISGVNILLYGLPGTGKTEYARLLASEAGLTLHEIESSNYLGFSAEPGQRMGTLMVTLRALEKRPNAVVLFDEAEDLFEPSSKGSNRFSNQISKAWLNQFLENTTVPVIWTSNSIGQIDPSALRRFTVVQEISPPPRQVRLKLAQRHFQPLGLSERDMQAIASLPMLTPAQIELTAKTIILAGPANATQASDWTHHHLTASRKAAGMGANRMPHSQAVSFDPRYLNTRHGPSLAKLLLHVQDDPRISLCFYGLPGTGKTELAHYLAAELGRDLVVKSGSDLMSKWVGETEQKIATMFEDSAFNAWETLLLLDEADSFLRDRQTATNRWEVSHTNEFLARMEQFPGTFICTTNLFDDLDAAVLRRFQFRVQFDALLPDQASALFEETFSLAAPHALGHVAGLVPADFSNVKRQLRFMDGEQSCDSLLKLLRVELTTRQGRRAASPGIGFLTT